MNEYVKKQMDLPVVAPNENTHLLAEQDGVYARVLKDKVGVSSWNDLQDKPFGELIAGDVLKWDGNTDGLMAVEGQVGQNGQGQGMVSAVWYKLSDNVPSFTEKGRAAVALTTEKSAYEGVYLNSNIGNLAQYDYAEDEVVSCGNFAIVRDEAVGKLYDFHGNASVIFHERGTYACVLTFDYGSVQYGSYLEVVGSGVYNFVQTISHEYTDELNVLISIETDIPDEGDPISTFSCNKTFYEIRNAWGKKTVNILIYRHYVADNPWDGTYETVDIHSVAVREDDIWIGGNGEALVIDASGHISTAGME